MKLFPFKKRISDEEFTKIVNDYEKLVYNLAYAALKNEADAFDVSQEVFIKVYRSISDFRGESSLSTWIYRITDNCIKDFVRSSARKRTSPLYSQNGDGEEIELEIPDSNSSHDPEMYAVKKDDITAVREAIDLLDFDKKQIIILRDIEGLSYEEIANMLEIKIETVKTRIFRARAALKNILEKRNFFM